MFGGVPVDRPNLNIVPFSSIPPVPYTCAS